MASKQHSPLTGTPASNDHDYRGDGPGKIGLTSDQQPDLVASSGVNQRTGGTWQAQGADSGKIAPPREILSDRNGPSDTGMDSDTDKNRPS